MKLSQCFLGVSKLAINHKRKAAMQRRSDTELGKFMAARTLSSAAAEYELRQRHGGQLPKSVLGMLG
jgi:hypothetical protein